MRLVVTIKNSCTKWQEKLLEDSMMNGSNGSNPVAGYNPLIPNQVGG